MAVKFLKRGKEAAEETQKADAEMERRRAAAKNKDNVYRYWMPEGEEQKITFLDGELNEAGVLDVPRYWEHNLLLGGSWKNWFPCTKDEEPCPLCDLKQPSLVYVFTIIDHRQWKEKKGDHKEHEHERKLYVCKGDTYKRLSKMAHKRGGLTGCTFDVSRIGDRAENVGSDFDFCEKLSFKELAKKYGLVKKGKTNNNKVCKPYDYDEVLKYYTAEQLREMTGLGEESAPVGSGDVNEQKNGKKKKDKKKKKKDKKKKDKGKKAKSEAPSEKDYAKEL